MNKNKWFYPLFSFVAFLTVSLMIFYGSSMLHTKYENLNQKKQKLLLTQNQLNTLIKLKDRLDQIHFDKNLFFSLLHFSLNQEEIKALEKIQDHIALKNPYQIKKRLELLKKESKLSFFVSGNAKLIQLKLKKPYELSKNNLERLIFMLQNSCCDLVDFSFETKQLEDDKIYLLNDVNLYMIYN